MDATAANLTIEQQAAFDDIMDNSANVFLTGEAGSGKSYLTNVIINAFEDAEEPIIVCAPTGIAATLIDGATCHRAFGLDLGVQKRSKTAALTLAKELDGIRAIIIDEISMVRLDAFEHIAAAVLLQNEKREQRNKGESPLQLIVIGDFSQIPPVITNKKDDTKPGAKSDLEMLRDMYGDDLVSGYAFESPNWKALGFKTHILPRNLRADGDAEFINMLNLARKGDLSCLPYFNARVCENPIYEDEIMVAHTNKSVEAYNTKRYDALNAHEETYPRYERGALTPGLRVIKETSLSLKIGARVIVNANVYDGERLIVANGTLATVVDLEHHRRSHKAPDEFMCMATIETDDGRRVRIGYHEYSIHDYQLVNDPIEGPVMKKVTIGKQWQLPLSLAWAITMHKSQGQTFEHVAINPEVWFPTPGLMYVALSRLRSIDGLRLTKPIDPKALRSDANVIAFLESATNDVEE